MDLASLIAREDLFNHLFSTVEEYYAKVNNIRVSFSFAENNKETNMVVKPKLSALSAVHISSKAREFYYSEWNIRNSLVKNLLVKIYLFIATRTGRYFAQYKFKITPEPMNLADTIIAPNNRTIRIFDYSTNVVGCIIKDGFSDKFFRNQIRFRETYKYDFILPMIDYGKNWFREPILHGHPLARITDEELYQSSKRKSIEYLRIIANDTVEYIDSIIYINSLCNKIMSFLDRAIVEKDIKSSVETLKVLHFAAKKARVLKGTIPTVMSHGDFQTGNIWVDSNKKTWIYDWETADRRSIWYDVTVLEYSLRRNAGWKELMGNPFPEKMELYDSTEENKSNYNAMKGIVLLEELCFYLEDLVELPKQWGVDIYDAFIMRLMEIEPIRKKENREY